MIGVAIALRMRSVISVIASLSSHVSGNEHLRFLGTWDFWLSAGQPECLKKAKG